MSSSDIKYDFYQYESHVVIAFYAKNLPKDAVDIEITKNEVRLSNFILIQ